MITLIQEIMRPIRMSQKKPCTIIQLFLPVTIDEHWFCRNILPKMRDHRAIMDNHSFHPEEEVHTVIDMSKWVF